MHSLLLVRDGLVTRDDSLSGPGRGGRDVERLIDEVESSENTWGWIDLSSDAMLDLEPLAMRFGIHRLAVEDAFAPHERPKLRRYDDFVSLTLLASLPSDTRQMQPQHSEDLARGASVSMDGHLAIGRIAAFMFDRFFVTVHDETFDMQRVVTRLSENQHLAKYGPGSAMWALLDYVVDDHIDTLEILEDSVDDLAEALFESDAGGTIDLQQRAFVLRRDVAKMRHATAPLREVVTVITRRDDNRVAQELQPYMLDVYDHVMHAADWTETLRDQISSVLETNVSLQGNRMNSIMKKVTSWAAIIAVPTAITGYFGQNLTFPGIETEWGWWLSCGLIVAASVSLYWIFRRNDWL